MQKLTYRFVVVITCLGLCPLLMAWGVFGHEHINRAAVLCLPQPLVSFFYNHVDFITQESTIPDLRKYMLNDKAEFPRHYINLEKFGSRDSLPNTLDAAKKKYDEVYLEKNGMLPWYINQVMEKLTKAFKEKQKTEILFLAADLGHYIADAHMPLHTSNNHDGQLTNQKGIHAFWEAQLPDLFGNSYNFNCQPAVYIPNIEAETWRMIFASHALADTLLLADSELKKQLPATDIYKTDASGEVIKNKFNQPVHTLTYANAYHKALKGMIETQMRLAITATASYWYTAWVNAGKPDLSTLDPAALSKSNAKSLQKEIKLMQQGKMVALGSEKEF